MKKLTNVAAALVGRPSKAAYGEPTFEPVPAEESEQEIQDYYEEDDLFDGYRLTWKEGKLNRQQPSIPSLERSISEVTEPVKLLAEKVAEQGEVVLLIDGLDRSPSTFWSAIEQDFQVLKRAKISVICAGPLSAYLEKTRNVKDYFDQYHLISPVRADPRKSSFLMCVLERRGARELLATREMQALCKASGGVLRDLISLARNAAENAYIDGSDKIKGQHVSRAVEQLGQSYLLGLGPDQIKSLLKLRDEGSFSAAANKELLVTRRVLLYRDPDRFEVHPALAPLLAAGTKPSTK